ncbi:MAG: hypothetical protein ABWY94_12355 [Pseudoxanthomonas sp.]
MAFATRAEAEFILVAEGHTERNRHGSRGHDVRTQGSGG